MNGGIASLFFRFRFALLVLCAVAAIAALYFVPQPAPLALGLSALGGFAVALARLRHWSLALATALAPLPGILWFGPAAYALSVAFAILMASATSDALLKGENPLVAMAQPLIALAAPLLFALLWSLHIPVQLQSLLAASAATALCLPPLALGVGFGEEAIVRGNRQREKMQRVSAIAARLAEPRWCLSITGIGVVLAVLGVAEIAARPPAFDWLAAPAAAAIVLALTRDGRGALAGLAAAALLLLFTAAVNGALLLFLLFAVSLGRAAARWCVQGESAPAAWMRTIEEQGGTILFAGLAAMIAAAPRGGALAALHAGYGLVAALLLFPAFAGALHHLFPRRRSVEELYRSNAS